MSLVGAILKEVYENSQITQRDLAENIGLSLGKINHAFKEAKEENYLELVDKKTVITKKGMAFLAPFKVDNAIILAAGFGSRFVPITYSIPKGLVKVKGKPMIEHQIEQLNQRGITDITILVGYLKEKFEYLIDKYGVDLIYNPEYATKNNLSTLYLSSPILKNTYILSADNWMSKNIFYTYEPNSLYNSVYKEGKTHEWCLTFDSKNVIKKVTIGGENSWVMYGPVFFSRDFSEKIKPLLASYFNQPGTGDFHWEQVYIKNIAGLKMQIAPKKDGIIYEFESLEELRDFDKSYYEHSNNKALETIAKVFAVSEKEISNFYPVKSGMTNQSFVFTLKEREYVFRIPGAGTKKFINRKNEKHVYDKTEELDFRENLIFFDENTGVKISTYYPNCRTVDSSNKEDVVNSMRLARNLHNSGIKVSHQFDLEAEIEKYKGYCNDSGAILYNDYDDVSSKMTELLEIASRLKIEPALTHVDCNPDNILLCEDGKYILIDWEYSGMCDPIIDVAAFAIYSYYDKNEADELLSIYLQREPLKKETLRLYLYVALLGFLWALWTAYKQVLGVEFGEYGMKMYRYAKNYYIHIKTLDLKELPNE